MDNGRKNIAIVIPAYKPKLSLIDLVKELSERFTNIVVVDDGSGNAYASIFERVRLIGNGVQVLTHSVNQGKGRALKTAFNHLIISNDSSIIGAITVDADGQHDIVDVEKVAETMESNAGCVILGCRSFKDASIPFRSRLGNRISKVVYEWACGLKVSDTQTGLRGIPFDLLTTLCKIVGERYDFETNMLLTVMDVGRQFKEVSIRTIYEDNNETSHFNPLMDSVRIYTVIVKYSISSLITSLADYIVFSVMIICGLPIVVSTYIARVLAGLLNFAINKTIVFRSKNNGKLQFIKYWLLVFFSGTISGLMITWLTSINSRSSPVLFKIPVEILLYILNYYIQRTYIFRGRQEIRAKRKD